MLSNCFFIQAEQRSQTTHKCQSQNLQHPAGVVPHPNPGKPCIRSASRYFLINSIGCLTQRMKTRRLQLLTSLGLCLLGAGGTGSLPAQSLQFTRVQRLTNSEVALTLTAPTGSAYRVESSTNGADWNGYLTFATNITTSLQNTDSAAPYLPTRYYRAVQLVGSNIVAGEHLATAEGDVIIQPRYHAAFVMQWNGKMIYNDPAPPATYTGLPKADLILVSHNHGDHFDINAINAVRGSNAVIIVPQLVYNSLTAAQKPLAIVLTNGAVTNVLGLTVEAIPAYNIPSSPSSYHPAGVGNGYVVTLGGKRIYIAGDTEDIPAMRALTNIDVAFLPMNRPYTMFVSNAVSATREFRPRIVYPYHFTGSPASDLNLFKRQVGTDLGIEVRLRKWY
jgi:L-ascorbate metabolism protein UlaG (beta-lactamase superfamily)